MIISHPRCHVLQQEKNKLTPKKMKGESHSKFTHFRHSPAGPDAVQPCKFRSVGNLTIDISTLQRSHWQFERVAATGPLEGSVAMRIQCSAEGGVEERGFLTIFQDISGYGDWHRRWCKLTSTEMSYWMYPEDESNVSSIVSLSLLLSFIQLGLTHLCSRYRSLWVALSSDTV